MKEPSKPNDIDEYIAAFPPEVQPILERIRSTVKNVAPEAEETISYRMPTFRFGGILIHFAAFREHIGIYPPVQGDEKLMKALAPYSGPKGNLKFPLDEPIPYALIRRVVKAKVKQQRDKIASNST